MHTDFHESKMPVFKQIRYLAKNTKKNQYSESHSIILCKIFSHHPKETSSHTKNKI